jgi:uncharacterized protein YdhG (YjbR/CyaY superfamily)
VSAAEIDAYLAALGEPARTTLEQLRATIAEIVPNAEQCISYSMPAFKLGGKAIAGFGAFKHHLSYFPHSGTVLPQLGDEIEHYSGTKGTLQFPIDEPLPKALVVKLVDLRRREAGV